MSDKSIQTRARIVKTVSKSDTVKSDAIKADIELTRDNQNTIIAKNDAFNSEFFELYVQSMKCDVSHHRMNVRYTRSEDNASKFNRASLDTKSAKIDASLEHARTYAEHALACNVSTSYIKRHIRYLLSHRSHACKMLTVKNANNEICVYFVRA